MSKDPGIEDPALVSPQPPARRAYSSERGVAFTLDSGWIDGMLENWESKTEEALILISDLCHHHKIRSHSAKSITPTLQYSTIPLYRITAYGTADFL